MEFKHVIFYHMIGVQIKKVEQKVRLFEARIISRLLGHADVNITHNIYVHFYCDGFDS